MTKINAGFFFLISLTIYLQRAETFSMSFEKYKIFPRTLSFGEAGWGVGGRQVLLEL